MFRLMDTPDSPRSARRLRFPRSLPLGDIASFAVVSIAVLVSFRAAPFLGFVDYDDPVAVLDPALRGGLSAESIRFAWTASPANLWHPLTFLSHALDFEIFGDWAGGHHLVSVFIHLASSLLLLGWLRSHTGERFLSLAVALVFAIHPLRVESVVWASERKDVLSVFFYLLTILFYSEWTKAPRSWRWFALAVAAGMFGILSKPSLMTLPGLLLLVDFWPLRRIGWQDRKDKTRWARILLEKIPFLALALLAAGMAWLTWSDRQVLLEAGDLTLLQRIGFAGLAYLSYLSRTFVPVDLVPFRSYPLDAPPAYLAVSVIILIGLTAFALLRFRGSPWLTVGWLWFLGLILPGSGLITISDHFAPDRYTYLAHAGLFAALAWEARRLGMRFRVPAAAGWGILACTAIALGFLTDRQTRVWKNAETLWTHTLETNGPHFLPLNQLGLVLVHQGEHDEGIRLLEQAIELEPNLPVSGGNLALALASAGRFDESIRRFNEAGPGLAGRATIREELIRIFQSKDRKDLAGSLWKERLREDPATAVTRLAAGDFFYGIGDESEAFLQYQEAASLDPGLAKATLSLGALLIKRGAVNEAIPLLEHSLKNARKAPEKADAHRTLAQAHLLGKNWQAAISSYEAGIRLVPDRELLLNELAQLLLDCPDPALRNPQRALALAERLETLQTESGAKPNPRFLRTLARARQRNGQVDGVRLAASSGLEAIFGIRAITPLPKPWTDAELSSLENWFRDALTGMDR